MGPNLMFQEYLLSFKMSDEHIIKISQNCDFESKIGVHDFR